MKTVLRIFSISDKNPLYVIAEAEAHVGGAIFSTGVKGSFKTTDPAKVGDLIDVGSCTVTALQENGYSKLVVTA